MHTVILIVPVLAAMCVLLNELAFGGRLFPSSHFAFSIGLSTIAVAAGATILISYRHRIRDLVRDLSIWVAIISAGALAYWLFG